MKKCFKLSIITPEEVFFIGDVVSLNYETTDGRRGILPDHCAMIASLVSTITRFIDIQDISYEAETSEGILKMKNNEVIMLCNSAKWIEEKSQE